MPRFKKRNTNLSLQVPTHPKDAILIIAILNFIHPRVDKLEQLLALYLSQWDRHQPRFNMSDETLLGMIIISSGPSGGLGSGVDIFGSAEKGWNLARRSGMKDFYKGMIENWQDINEIWMQPALRRIQLVGCKSMYLLMV